MSRTWVDEPRTKDQPPRWAMFCDVIGCKNRSDARRTQKDLPLEEFARAGWFIAATHGDRCPSCAVGYQPPADGVGRRSRVMDDVAEEQQP